LRLRRIHGHLDVRAHEHDPPERIGRELHVLKPAARTPSLHTDVEDPEVSVPPAAARLAAKTSNVLKEFFSHSFGGGCAASRRDATRTQNQPMWFALVRCGWRLIRPGPRRNQRRERTPRPNLEVNIQELRAFETR
jgi:hypothetical protein